MYKRQARTLKIKLEALLVDEKLVLTHMHV